MRAALAFALALAPTAARADDHHPIRPDPRAVAAAREANLEPESVREGFAIGVAVGPAVQLAYGIGTATGSGAGFNLRLGTVASPRWVWLLELGTTAFPHGDTANQSAVVTFGGQLYGDTETEQFGGLGALGAGGFDLFRRRGLAVSAEGATTLALYRGGSTVIGVSLQLGVSWY